MLHACAVRFDLTGNLEKFWKLNKALADTQKTALPRIDMNDIAAVLSLIFWSLFRNLETD